MIDFKSAAYDQACLPLAQASTLPSEAFTSPEVYAAEVEALFSKEWLCVGRIDQVPNPGDYFTLDLAGDRLVVARDTKGVVRVLSRLCRHRGAEIVTGSGNARSFQCPYHAWTYRLDGSLVGAPYMEGSDRFDREKCALPEIRSEAWEGFLFVNLDGEANSLGDQISTLTNRFAPYQMGEFVALETATYESPFNWKVLMDNFMEAYHHIAIHKNTLEPIFPGAQSSSPDNDGPYSILLMPAREDIPLANPEGAGLPKFVEPPAHEEHALVVGSIYPLHLFAPSAQALTWYHLLPTAHDHFTLRIYNCFPRETIEDPKHAQAIADFQGLIKVVHDEDIKACEATWAGLNARSYDAGVLSPLEKPIWQFNTWWIDRMRANA